MAADFAPLLTTMTELVSDERLVGPIEDFCLLVPGFLVEIVAQGCSIATRELADRPRLFACDCF